MSRNRLDLRLAFFIVAAVAAGGCGKSGGDPAPQPNPPGNKGTGGRSGSGGSSPGSGGAGNPGAGGSTAGSTGTTDPGTGGGTAPGTGGAAGSGTDAAPAGDVPADSATPPPDGMPPAAGKCDPTPRPNAGMLKLAFKQLAVSGGSLDSAGPGKSATGLTEIQFVPGTTNEIFVAQKGARLNHLRLEGDGAVLLRRHTVPGVFAEEDCGLISFAFDPDYQSNRYVYAAFCATANRSKVVRFTVGETLTDPVDIIQFSEPSSSAAFHSIGSMGFDRNKNMWLLHGEFYNQANAQNLNSTMGKLLRFIPSRTAGMGGAMPAPGNPYVGMAGRSPLVWAYGFRSPWRGYLDSKGRFLVGDVGPGTAEELNLVTMPGQNFGWNGSRVGPCSGCAGHTNPISTYRVPNDPYEGEGNAVWEARPRRSIWVGVQYEDCGNDRYGGAMTGVYVFGDLFAGWVRGAVIDDAGKKTADRHLGDVSALSAWTQGPDGYLYAVRFGNYGDHLTNQQIAIFRVEKAP